MARSVRLEKYVGTPPSTPTTPGDVSRPGGTTSSGSGSGSGSSSYDAQRNAERAAAGQRYLDQAAALEAQVAAIRYALETGFQAGLDQNLTDVGKALEEQLAILKTSHSSRARSFLDSAADAEKSQASQSEGAFENLVRERQDGISAVLEQGAGETDALRAMVMSARNWSNNMREGNRAYFDTMRSVNSGLTDLNLDTQNAMAGAYTSAESERERLWQDFYNRRSESFTQLGNIRGQQREYYASAREYGKGTPNEETARKESEDAFMNAAKEAGKSYERQAIPPWIKDYKGQEKVEARQTNTDLGAAMQFTKPKKAQGSVLRKWS
jgi:hypothetical protein